MDNVHQPPPFRRALPDPLEIERNRSRIAAEVLPFSRLNLFRNPFGELTLRERAELAVPLPEVTAALRDRPPGPFALQFLGHPGRGKTTHMMALRLRYPQAPYIYLPEHGPLPRLPLGPRIPGFHDPQPVLFVDETQRLPASTRRRLFSPPGMLGTGGPDLLIVGTHEDHSAEFAAAGRAFVGIHIRGITAEHLAKIFRLRIQACIRDKSKPVPFLDTPAILWLIQTYRDDIRGMEHHLYACFQSAKENGAIDPSALPVTPWPPPELAVH
ncbi:MAG: hypothetical protein ACAI35_02000 [Candidatus Methylacidiphilales bacterium]